MSDDITKLRNDYKEVTSKNAFNGWDAEELQKRIDEALAGPTPPKTGEGTDPDLAPAAEKPAAKPKAAAKPAIQTVTVTIKRDVWDGDGNRHRKGTIVDMPVEDAMDAIENGSVSRVKG